MTTETASKFSKCEQNRLMYPGCIEHFTLCQEIELCIKEYGQRIGQSGILFPAFSKYILTDLEQLKKFCARAIEAVKMAEVVRESK